MHNREDDLRRWGYDERSPMPYGRGARRRRDPWGPRRFGSDYNDDTFGIDQDERLHGEFEEEYSDNFQFDSPYRNYRPNRQGSWDSGSGFTPTSRDQDRHRSFAGGFRGHGPKGYQRSDERIREEVCECLTDDDCIDASKIEVSVANGEVSLSGEVPNRRAKRHAEELVEDLSGVKDVANHLRVGGEKMSSESDSSRMAKKSSSSHMGRN